tara:strand:+ start:143 stop:295 length:153 start_codon:yes stop_codon:yes gene_type:complete
MEIKINTMSQQHQVNAEKIIQDVKNQLTGKKKGEDERYKNSIQMVRNRRR